MSREKLMLRATCESLWVDEPYKFNVGHIVKGNESSVRYRVMGVTNFGHELLVRPLSWWRQPRFWRGFRRGLVGASWHPAALVLQAAVPVVMLTWLLWRLL